MSLLPQFPTPGPSPPPPDCAGVNSQAPPREWSPPACSLAPPPSPPLWSAGTGPVALPPLRTQWHPSKESGWVAAPPSPALSDVLAVTAGVPAGRRPPVRPPPPIPHPHCVRAGRSCWGGEGGGQRSRPQPLPSASGAPVPLHRGWRSRACVWNPPRRPAAPAWGGPARGGGTGAKAAAGGGPPRCCCHYPLGAAPAPPRSPPAGWQRRQGAGTGWFRSAPDVGCVRGGATAAPCPPTLPGAAP